MEDYQSNYTGEQVDSAVEKALNTDSSPTRGSTKFVTSGGVYNSIDALQTQVDNAGKVDDVKVNGISVLDPETKEANINITASVVEGDTPGTPTASATMQDGNINIEFEHVKGTKGDKGDKGDTVVLDPEHVQYYNLYPNVGFNTDGAMTQAATTAAIDNIEAKLGNVEEITIAASSSTASRYLNTSGEVKGGAGSTVYVYNDIKSGVYNLTFAHSTNSTVANNDPAICYYDSNGDYIANSGEYTGNAGVTVNGYKLTVPSGAKTIKVASSISPTLEYVNPATSQISDVKSGLDEINGKIESTITIGHFSKQEDKYIKTDGSIAGYSSNHPRVQSFLPIQGFNDYYLSLHMDNSSAVGVAYYDYLGNFISSEISGSGTRDISNYHLTIPTGTTVIKTTSFGTDAVLNGNMTYNEMLSLYPPKAENKKLKILCIGNSFTYDSMSYVPFILRQYGLDVTLGIVFVANATLQMHYARFTGDGTYGYLTKYTEGRGWHDELADHGNTIDDVLANDDWDLVTLQAGPTEAYGSYAPTFGTYLEPMAKILATKATHPIRLGLNLVHSANSTDAETLAQRFVAIAANYQKAINETQFDVLLPYGTAIQNCRTCEAVSNVHGTTQMLPDELHLAEGMPCLCASYANAVAILNAFGMGGKGIMGEKTRPDETWVEEHHIYGQQTAVSEYEVTDDMAYIAQVAATHAAKHPYEVTDMSGYTVTDND